MEYLNPALLQEQPQMILCCQCGTPIEPNPANMCVGCLRTRVDITEGVQKQASVYFCKFCERYLQPPAYWLSCGRDSPELLSLCVSRLHGMNKVRLVHAEFIWTEPHSKRLKLKLTIQKEVINAAILEQTFIVEFTVFNQMCTDCQKKETNNFWKAVVQVRQKASHKKTFFYLEQLILKSAVHANVIKVKEFKNGMDFYYAVKQDARKLVDFIVGVVPCKYKTSQELVSHDTHTNVYNYKHTFSVEIVPICKDNIVCLPKKLSQSVGNISQIGICTRVTTSLQITDPSSLQVVDIPAASFWRTPFSSICLYQHLTKFLVLQCEPLATPPTHLHVNDKFHLADVWVLPLTDTGCSDQQIHCRTHLGHLLHPGDEVLGYDFCHANINNEHMETMDQSTIPDVVIVKKCYGDHKKRSKKRNWHLQQLDKELVNEVDSEEYERDMAAFMEDLEEDKTYRQNINIFLDPRHEGGSSHDGEDDDELPSIPVEEMMRQLTIQPTH